MSKLLLDEAPLQIQASLATAIGLNEAIALQQLHWVLQNPKMGKEVGGIHYVYMSIQDWRKGHFPFWSGATIQRTFDNLEKMAIIKSRGDLNSAHFDRTKWYAIDYAGFAEIEKSFIDNKRVIEYRKMKNGHRKMNNALSQDEMTIPQSSSQSSEISDSKIESLSPYSIKESYNVLKEAVSSVNLSHSTGRGTYSGDFGYDYDGPDDAWHKQPIKYPPTTPMAIYLAEQPIGKWKNHWAGFKSAKERNAWQALEEEYAKPTIQKKIDYFVSQKVPPKKIVHAVITALRDNVKPDKPEPGETWDTLKMDS